MSSENIESGELRNEINRIGLDMVALRNLNSHNNFAPSPTQEQYYRDNGSTEDILQYTRPGCSIGVQAEKITKEYFNLDNRTSTSHDHQKLGKKIEQKTGRYHANGGEWRWQHIEMQHNWDYLLVCGLDFHGFKFFIIERNQLESILPQLNAGQGAQGEDGVANPQQGYWFTKSNFTKNNLNFNNYFTELFNEEDLINYIT